MRIDGPQITGSFNLNGDAIADLDALVTTSSFNMMTASMATTASNTFKGTQTYSGSIVPSVNNTYDLGSPTHQFRHVYISTGSLYIDGTKVLGSTSSELQITTDSGQSFKVLETGADTITLQSADGNVTLTSTGGGDIVIDPSTGVIGLKGTVTIYTGNKIVSSDGNSIQFGNGIAITGSIVATSTNLITGSGQITSLGFATTGSNTFNGNLTVTGYIDAQELRTTYISSSILYRSGSTKFGDELGDTHAFTGSLLVSGSISVPGSGLISGSVQVLNGSGVWSGSAQLPSGVVSGSVQVDVMSTTNIARLATTGSNTFNGDIIVQGNNSSNIRLWNLYSGDPAHVGLTIQNRNGDYTFSHNSNGGGTGINGTLSITSANGDYAASITNVQDSSQGLLIRSTDNDSSLYLLNLQSSTGATSQTWIDRFSVTKQGYVGINTAPSFYLDVQANVANTFYTIAQFENRDYTSGTRSFIRVRNWLSAGGSYSSYFGQGQDGKTYIIANNSARGGDIVIDGGNGNVGIADSNPSQKLTVAGSIKMNQDAALRAGSSDNWIIGQDSDTNVIHLGSASVANDIRFDSSNQTGNVIIKSNGRLGVNTTDPATTFDVNGYMGLRSNNYFYFGHTTSNIGGWTTRMYANGATHTFNANGFAFTNEGYGSSTWLSINSSGNATFSNNLTVNGTTSTFNVNASSVITLTSAGTNASMIKAASGDELYLGGNDTWQMRLSGGNVLMDNGGNVGIAISSPQQKLSVGGSIRANRSIYNWFQAGSNDWDGYQYLHLKTNMSSGAGGNVDHTMSLFYGRLYSYSSAYIREGHYGFHNWSGTLYNPVTTGNFWTGGYSSSDGYVVLIVALGGGSYLGINIDWHQSYPYTFRDRIVTSYNHSNSASALY